MRTIVSSLFCSKRSCFCLDANTLCPAYEFIASVMYFVPLSLHLASGTLVYQFLVSSIHTYFAFLDIPFILSRSWYLKCFVSSFDRLCYICIKCIRIAVMRNVLYQTDIRSYGRRLFNKR
ncbi:hypothetical protein K450DRAFT_231650 [Umbelopsis ramanniana AG]|uniref:Uncharacterized protein n=1 Tax=Umbelopsis ramanniana AG TaxID=1314678 RepID=A0AAD5HEN2_UMBRA|nr:uncharacterized protein K450DRAFT_231650 [Umbelopsis ramanniana AG]KAI8581507.1 hypothetical protein K450DRAFT_231650 [Umbelopsis ramanniana AG]